MQIKSLLSGDRAVPARLAALLAIALGLLSAAGWVFGIRTLTSIVPGWAEMKINTAVCFMLAGSGLFLLATPADRTPRRVARGAATAVLLVGALTLCQYAFGWDFNIDQALVPDRAGLFNAFRGRMSPYTTVGFISIGAALLCLSHARLASLAKGFSSLTALVGLVSLLGYLWNATDLITDAVIPPVAINTATAFTLLGAGVWLAPGQRPAPKLAQLNFSALEIRILVGFFVALGLVLAAGSYTYRSNEQFANSVVWIAHTQEVRADLADLTSTLAGADLALRDYISTHDRTRREEYLRLVKTARQHFNEVANLTADNSGQQRLLEDLRPLLETRVNSLASVMRAFDDYGLEAARATIGVTRHAGDVPAIRAVAQRMDNVEAQLLSDRELLAKSGRRSTLLSLLVTLSLAAILFAALFRGVHGEMLARRVAENALRASDAYNRSILDTSPDSLSVLSTDGHLLSMTAQSCRMMGVTDFASIAGSDWLALWRDSDAARGALESARAGKAGRFRGFCSTYDGVAKWWDVIVEPLPATADQPPRLLAAARDISDVVRAETNLREAHTFLDTLIENLPVLIIVKDATTRRIVSANRAAANFIGLTPQEAVGKDLTLFLEPDAARATRERDAELLQKRQLVNYPDESFSGPDGARTFRTARLLIFTADGAPQFIVSMSVDVTEQKLREQAISELNLALQTKAAQLEATVEQLAASNSELESFSYSVSHDLRAPLRAIDGFSLMIEEDYTERMDEEGRRYLKVIRDNSKRMGALIDDLLSFSQLGRLPVASHEINVDALVREVVDEQLVSCGQPQPRVVIANLPPAHGDRNLLRQVWTNLISNAIKYSSKAAEPQVTVDGAINGKEISYSVRDNGVGFDMEYYNKLFGVFQRLHRHDEFTGTGVGLAIVHRVVTRHGGRVWAEGKINGGATFSFALPKESVHG